MPLVSEIFGAAFLTSADLAGRTFCVEIASAVVEEIGEEREKKLVLGFKGAKKSLVVNKSNASTIAGAYGDNTDAWLGRKIELFTIQTTFAGRVCDGIRVRPVVAQPAPAQQPAPPPAGLPMGVPASQTSRAMQHAASLDGDVPF